MRRLLRRLAGVAVWWTALVAASIAAAPAATVVVSAPDRDYREVPVSVPISRPAPGTVPVLTPAGDRQPVPCQVEREGDRYRLWWMVRNLKRGTRRAYQLTFRRGKGTPPAVVLTRGSDAVDIAVEGKPFTRYVFTGGPRPYCYPFIGPTGVPITRHYPMREDVPGEPKDHPHHRSFWFTHGEVNGHDFWAETDRSGQIRHRAFEAVESGPVFGRLRARNDWVAVDGKKVCEDVREVRVWAMGPDLRVLDFTVTLRATDGEVLLGDTKEGSFAFRVAQSMQVAGGAGHIVNARGDRDTAAWGKPAEWCDYYGPVDGGVVGIAILDHPANFGHPTHWHARDYGLFAANPFGLRDFINDRTGRGKAVIPGGQEFTLRYRVVVHKGTAADADIPAFFGEYANPPRVTIRQ